MTWPPVQDPCTEPCCTGQANVPNPAPVAVTDEPLRECGVTGCGHCDIVWPAPGGGDRLPTRKATT